MVPRVVARFLALLSAVLAGFLTGGMILIQIVLVPFWRGVPPDQFRTWFAAHFDRIRTMMIPLGAGAAAVNAASAVVQTANRSPSELVAVAAQFATTHISGTPTFWRSFLLAAPPGSLPLKQITLGGEAVDQPTLDRLAQRFPEARITHIYASTEAGALFSVHDGRAGFPRAWLHGKDAGVGLRIALPGAGTIRADVANGLRHGGTRWTFVYEP